MNERQPIRVRLMLWYSVVLALSLIVFAGIVWIGLLQSLVSSREAALRDRFHALEKFIANQEGQPAMNPEEMKEEAGEFGAALPPEFRFKVSDPSGATLYASPGAPARRVLGSSRTLRVLGHPRRIDMWISMDSVDEILASFSRILVLSVPLVLLIASAGGYWMSRRALAPVRAMAEAARSINPSDLTMRVELPPAKDELRLLAEMWNGMLTRLEEGVKRTRQFTADASHDLRTPLSTIHTAAEVMLRQPRSPEEYQETLRRILRHAQRATALVENLLTLARMDAMNVLFVPGPVEVGSLLQSAGAAFLPLASAKNLDLRLTLPPDPVWLPGDRAELQRLVTTLIDNAIKNTNEGKIDVRLSEAGDSALLEVEDTGNGISPEDLPHIFERFYRGDKSRSSLTGGSGLGLAIADSIVRSHGGTITVESYLKKGTAFRITLPC